MFNNGPVRHWPNPGGPDTRRVSDDFNFCYCYLYIRVKKMLRGRKCKRCGGKG